MERQDTHPTTAKPETCTRCGASHVVRWGKDRNGFQRFRCSSCRGTFVLDRPERPLGAMRLDLEKAKLVLSLLVEGSSIRSAERVTGVHRDTICRLLVVAGRKCEAVLDRLVKDVEVDNVQADEIWGFVQKQQATKTRLHDLNLETGDAWTFVAMERDSKLVC